MAEWCNSQKKSISDFRKSIQERLEEANPRRQLVKDETTKLVKLEEIAERLQRGENAQHR